MNTRIKHLLLLITIPFVYSCEAQSTSKDNNSSVKSSSDSIPVINSQLIDSLKTSIGAEDLDKCIDYLDLYFETGTKKDLDSALIRFEKFAKRNETPDPYLRMGSTCEILGENALATRYYRKGKEAALKLLNNNEFTGQVSKVLELYDIYLSILLKEKVDIKKLSNLESELSDSISIYSNMLIPEGHSRDELLDAFSF